MSVRPFLFLLLLFLAACQPADDGLALQVDYLQRLNNVLDGAALTRFDPTSLTRYRMPPRRERLLVIAEVRISLLELLIDVQRCPDLQRQISQRNSSLGKQLSSSSRLAYEGDLLRAIEACAQHLQRVRDHALSTTLDELARQKRAQLPLVFWNALNGSAEFERYLRFNEHGLPPEARPDGAALDALEQLATLGSALPGRLPPSAERLDPLFFALHASDQGGRLINSLASLSHSLNQASDRLETRQRERPICPLGQATRRAHILQNIFVKYYAGALQPYLAEVDRRGERWARSLNTLADLPHAPVAVRTYLAHLAASRHSLWADFQAANARHVKAWQQTLNSCGLAPGQPGWRDRIASRRG